MELERLPCLRLSGFFLLGRGGGGGCHAHKTLLDYAAAVVAAASSQPRLVPAGSQDGGDCVRSGSACGCALGLRLGLIFLCGTTSRTP
jgi:hypothetical protein